MHRFTSLLAALATATLLVQPAFAALPDWKLPDCEDSGQSGRYDHIEDISGFWGRSLAEKYTDQYIKQNGDHSNWTQDLYMELFPQYDHTDRE